VTARDFSRTRSSLSVELRFDMDAGCIAFERHRVPAFAGTTSNRLPRMPSRAGIVRHSRERGNPVSLICTISEAIRTDRTGCALSTGIAPIHSDP
jgi:hypothetical protein